jgi:hypothetical protein
VDAACVGGAAASVTPRTSPFSLSDVSPLSLELPDDEDPVLETESSSLARAASSRMTSHTARSKEPVRPCRGTNALRGVLLPEEVGKPVPGPNGEAGVRRVAAEEVRDSSIDAAEESNTRGDVGVKGRVGSRVLLLLLPLRLAGLWW